MTYVRPSRLVRAVSRGALYLAASGCRDATPSAPVDTPVAAAPSAGPTEAAASPEPVPAHVGSYVGETQVLHHQLQAGRQRGTLVGWIKDDGKQYSGDALVTLHIDAAGEIGGTLEGPLGTLVIEGWWSEAGMRLRFSPSAADGFQGHGACQQDGSGLNCVAHFSSADGRFLRRAAFALAGPVGETEAVLPEGAGGS